MVVFFGQIYAGIHLWLFSLVKYMLAYPSCVVHFCLDFGLDFNLNYKNVIRVSNITILLQHIFVNLSAKCLQF